MGRRIVYTKITPLPADVPRQLALDMLHSHEEVIQLNPFVTGVETIEAPRTAAGDEFFSHWYRISQIITWAPGLKKKMAFKGVFHDQPWGMQSHLYAPMGVNMRNKYRIGGNQPGEPLEPRELGVDTPGIGLYLREDVDITCSMPLMSGFVKKEVQAATGIMVGRLNRKAELLHEGRLHAMFENGKLKTAKPSGDPTFADRPLPPPGSTPGISPPHSRPGPRSRSSYASDSGLNTPAVDEKGFGRYRDVVQRRQSQTQRRGSYIPQYQQQGYQGPDHARPGAKVPGIPEMAELPGSFLQLEQNSRGLCAPPFKAQGQVFGSELPSDIILAPPNQQNLSPLPANQYQTYGPPQGPPRHSPALPAGHPSHDSSSGSGYQIANLDQTPPQQYQYPGQVSPQQHQRLQPAHGNSAPRAEISRWQRGLHSVSTDDPNQIRVSRPPSQYVNSTSEPDHNCLSMHSIQQTPVVHQVQPANGTINQGEDDQPGRISDCPVCGLFEGDEAAISHHVSKAHFV